ncbi:alcohol dehydrogenase [compost metagenome]
MIAMSLSAPGARLEQETRADPRPGPGEIRLRIRACGVCRTDLHIVDGDLPLRRRPVVPGHEAIGVVDALGPEVAGVRLGDRLGATWLAQSCGRCRYCREGQENLCDDPAFTGWTRDGGFAEAMIARADFCLPIPSALSDVEAAPLMCAGLIGYRAWRKACEGRPVRRLGLYGFGAAAHLLAQLAVFEDQAVYAFTRQGDRAAQDLARDLGCVWAGDSRAAPPEALDAAILFAPAGELIPQALRAVRKGGTVVCGGIHMSDIPAFPYALLWEERRLTSVANLTRQDGREYLPRAVRAGVRAHVVPYPLARANEALDDLRRGAFVGAAVLVIEK